MKTIIKTAVTTVISLLIAHAAASSELALRFTAGNDWYDYDAEYSANQDEIPYVTLPRTVIHYEPYWINDAYPWWIDSEWFFYCQWPRLSLRVNCGFNDWWPIFSYPAFPHRWLRHDHFLPTVYTAFHHHGNSGSGGWRRRDRDHDPGSRDDRPNHRFENDSRFKAKPSDWFAHKSQQRHSDYTERRRHDREEFSRRETRRPYENEKMSRRKDKEDRTNNSWQQPREQRQERRPTTPGWDRQRQHDNTALPRWESKKPERPTMRMEQKRAPQRQERLQRAPRPDRNEQKIRDQARVSSREQREVSRSQTHAPAGRENKSNRETKSRREQSNYRR